MRSTSRVRTWLGTELAPDLAADRDQQLGAADLLVGLRQPRVAPFGIAAVRYEPVQVLLGIATIAARVDARQVRRPWRVQARTVFGCTPRKRAASLTVRNWAVRAVFVVGSR